MNVEESNQAMASDGKIKARSCISTTGQSFSVWFYTFVSLHGSNDNGVVRIFVGHSQVAIEH